MADEQAQPEASGADIPVGGRSGGDRTKMAKATAGIGGFTFMGFALAGLISKMFMSRLFGRTDVANAYNWVYKITQDVFRTWEKLIRPTILPVFGKEREQSSEADAWRFASSLVNLQAIALVALVGAIAIFAEPIARALTQYEGRQLELAILYLRIIAPSVFFLSLAVTGYMLLNAYKRFHLAAFGDHIFVKLLPMVALIPPFILYLWKGGTPWWAIYALLGGVLAGSAAKIAIYAWGLRGHFREYRFHLSLSSPAMNSAFLLMLPLVVGVGVAFLRNLIENWFLTGVEGGAAMTLVTYAKAPVDVPIQILPVALSIAIFPFITEYFRKKQHAELLDILGKGIRITFLAFLPLSVGLFILAHPMLAVVFGGGEFKPADVAAAAPASQFYAIAYVFLGLEIIILQFFYAAHNTLTPTWTGVLTSALQILILWLIVGLVPVPSFTIAFTASKALKVALLFALLWRAYPDASIWKPMLRRTIPAVLNLIVIATVMGAAVWFLNAVLEGPLPATSKLKGLLRLAICGGAGAAIYVAGVHLLRIEEWRQTLDFIIPKLKRLVRFALAKLKRR